MVRFTDEQCAKESPEPDAITNLRCEGDTWRFEIEGAAAPLRQWLAAQSVRDFTVGPPDLETIFHSYYQQEQN